jgi:hypothetical protein
MNQASLTPELQRLHHLAYSPGSWMSECWWSHLGLARWQDSYQRFATCRPALNRLIRQRRALDWTTLPACLTPRQRDLLALESRFVRLITTLGLVALNCPDHLLHKRHRQALLPHLQPHHCNQLLGLHQGWSHTEPAVPAAVLAATALQVGARWWQRDATPCPVADVLSLHLPPASEGPVSQADNAVPWLFKIGRFL